MPSGKDKDAATPTVPEQSPDAAEEGASADLAPSETAAPPEGGAVDYGGGVIVAADNTVNLPRPYTKMPTVG